MATCAKEVSNELGGLSAEEAEWVEDLCLSGCRVPVIVFIVQRRRAKLSEERWESARIEIEAWFRTLGEEQKKRWRARLDELTARSPQQSQSPPPPPRTVQATEVDDPLADDDFEDLSEGGDAPGKL